ncbi:helix-turn-helix domain-containing protein [Chamaesiphon sp.]|uniref:helix-turn-helix domain-containing protein n=1 Tax=Chamaesiphon sp. TaxID=2814140 RepID=UPI003593D60D
MDDRHILKLQALMHKVGIRSFSELARSSKTSERTIRKLRSGGINTLRWQTLANISSTLHLTINELTEIFGTPSSSTPERQQLDILRQEYQLLHQQCQQQRATLQAEFQYQSLQALESFLTYFPAAKAAAAQNPDFPASKLIPLVQSIDRLIAQWGVTVIGEIGAEVAYDPRWHQLIAGNATPDDVVTIRYVGYRQGDKLIFRAKVGN